MAYSDNPQLTSVIAATTFAAGDLYKFVAIDAQGHATLVTTTGNNLAFGVLYGVTKTTSTEAEAVPVAYGGVVKVRAKGSTMAQGNFVAASSDAMAIAPSTDGYVIGTVIHGTSGTTGRILTMAFTRGPLSTP